MKAPQASASTAPIIPPELAATRRRPAPLSRADTGRIALWYAEVDRVLLFMVLLLIAVGLLAIAVASPVAAAITERQGGSMHDLNYLFRQLFFLGISLPVLLWMAMRTKKEIRQIGLWGTVAGIVGLFLVQIVGTEVNGATRWLGPGMFRLQPSEFLKPCFAIAMGWLLSCKVEDDKLPLFSLTAVTTGLIAVLLMLQPDFGQTMIFLGTWLVLVFVAGLPMRVMGFMAGGGLGVIIAAYFSYSVAHDRINIWLFGEGDAFQVERAHATLSASGLIGAGPFAGEAKFALPEAHTDYIFSVIGEEFGLFACAIILALYLAMIVRVIQRLREERDQFIILAGTGLIAQFGGQAMINIAVNTQLAPSKGMTLPFISYGGSSLIALSLAMGLLLALTRRNPYLVAPAPVSGWINR
jgi:cell division protein FtsW